MAYMKKVYNDLIIINLYQQQQGKTKIMWHKHSTSLKIVGTYQ